MSISPPPLFLPVPGTPTIEWRLWSKMFSNYLLVIDGYKFTEEKQCALLQTCLGTEGQRVFETLPDKGSSL